MMVKGAAADKERQCRFEDDEIQLHEDEDGELDYGNDMHMQAGCPVDEPDYDGVSSTKGLSSPLALRTILLPRVSPGSAMAGPQASTTPQPPLPPCSA